MSRVLILFTLTCCIGISSVIYANTPPTVTNVTASQRTDGSKKVDIRYNLWDADNDKCTVSVQVSNDGGFTWTVPVVSFLPGSAVGENIPPGEGKVIIWDAGKDALGVLWSRCRIKVIADDGILSIIPINWVPIVDSGFIGFMSQYEITNAQYADFLNDAKTAGYIFVHTNGLVYEVGDVNYSRPYIRTYAASSTSQIIYSNGAFTVRKRDGYSMENHPVTGVSRFGAAGFCIFYGWRLPSASEWRAAANYDGSFIYGCGIDIDPSKANYNASNPLGLSSPPYTTPVNYYPSYGYGLNDMAGNALEWTSTVQGNAIILCGGSWDPIFSNCKVDYDVYKIIVPVVFYDFMGFRPSRRW